MITSIIRTDEYFLFLSIKLTPKIKKNNNTVYTAGYILKASENSPSKTRTTARWAPHPKHSTPRNFLLGQVSIKSSIFIFLGLLCSGCITKRFWLLYIDEEKSNLLSFQSCLEPRDMDFLRFLWPQRSDQPLRSEEYPLPVLIL